jgi:hypothetical protein
VDRDAKRDPPSEGPMGKTKGPSSKTTPVSQPMSKKKSKAARKKLNAPESEGEEVADRRAWTEDVTGLHQIVYHTQVMLGTLVMWRTHLAVNKISVGGLAANEYALDWVPIC